MKRQNLATTLFAIFFAAFATSATAQTTGAVSRFENIRICHEFSGSDEGAKIAACIADLPSTGGIADARGFAANIYSTATITVSKPVKLLLGAVTLNSSVDPVFTVTSAFSVEGVGHGLTTITETSTTNTVFSVATTQPFQLRNVAITSSANGQTGGAAVSLDGIGGGSPDNNKQSHFENVRFLFQWIGIDSKRAEGWYITNCNFNGVTSRGIRLKNTLNGDAGDISITDNEFNPKTIGAGTAAIELIAASGLRINGNKFFHFRYDVYAHIDTSGGASSGLTQLSFTSNISEAKETTGAVLYFDRAGAGRLMDIVIADNYYASLDSLSGLDGNFVKFTAGTAQWANVCGITGNIHYMTGSGTSMEFAGNGNGDLCTISGNLINGGGGTSNGIVVGSGYSRMDIGQNFLYNLNTPTTISAGSTRGFFVYDRVQIGGNPGTGGTTEPIALMNNANIVARNARGNAWVPLIKLDGTDLVNIASGGAATRVGGALVINGRTSSVTYSTSVNCASNSVPAACASAASGGVLLPAGSASIQVNTTAVTADSRILVLVDTSAGSPISATCNTSPASLGAGYYISAKSAGTSFTISSTFTPLTNPVCLSFFIVN